MADDYDDIDDFLADSGSEFEPESESDDESIVSDADFDSSPNKTVAKPKPRKPKRDVAPHEAPKRKNLLSPSTAKDSPKKKPKIAAVSSMQAASRPRLPFNRLMENVVFVISGFQNPLRSDIRNSALAMGAKYKADWDRSCTHLICAFPNTPKFNQVRGLGKIVKKDWVEQCYESRKRLPWRRFALDTQDLTQPESEEEIWEIVDPPMDNRRRLNDSSSEDDEIEKEVKRIQHIQKASPANVTLPTNASPGPQSRLSEDDEPPKLNIYEVETEDETDGAADVLENLPKMPSFFESFNFLILDDIEESERAKLTRYIAARLGNVVTDVQELSPSNPTYCITEDDSRLKEVKDAFPDIKGTRPDWIWFCHDENCFKDSAPFSI